MKKVTWIFILVIAVSGIVCLRKCVSLIPLTSSRTSTEYEWNEINLPNGYDWKEGTLTDEYLFNMRAFYDDRYAGAKLPGQNGYIVFPSGRYYSAVVEDMETNSFLGQALLGKITDSMRKYGWEQSIQYGNYHITGMSGDEPMGSHIGYVKRLHDQLRTIVYSYSVTGTWVKSVEGPGRLECPCKTTLGIFFSDSADLSHILPH